MTTPNNYRLITDRETIDEEGNIVPAQERLLPINRTAENLEALIEDHRDISRPLGAIAVDTGNQSVGDPRERGRRLSEKWLADPDSFGADWPTIQMNRKAREAGIPEPPRPAVPQEIKDRVNKLAKPEEPTVMERFLARQRERYNPKS